MASCCCHDGGERHRFGAAGSDLHAELVVQDPAFYRRLLLGQHRRRRNLGGGL